MTLEQLRAKRNEAANKMKAIADLEVSGSALTDEQAAEFEQASKDFDSIDAQVKRLERSNGVQAILDQPRPSVGARQVAESVAAGPVYPGGPEAVKTFDTFGDQIRAVVAARTGGHADQRLQYQDYKELGASTQTLGTGSTGGFLVQENFRSAVLQVDPAENILLSRILEQAPGEQPDAPTTQPVLNQSGNQQGGVTVSRAGENTASPETNFATEQRTWTPKRITAHTPLSMALLRNWAGGQTTAEVLLRQALAAKREQEIYSGDGVKQMLGILNSDASYRVARTTADTVVYEDLANMLQRMIPRWTGAICLYSPLLLAALMKLKDDDGRLIWLPSAREGAPAMILGMPAFPYEFASSVGSLGDLAFVKPNPCYVVQRGSGPFIDVGFSGTDFLERRQRLLIEMFDDGAPWLDAPFKLHNGTEVSPFVLLDVPA